MAEKVTSIVDTWHEQAVSSVEEEIKRFNEGKLVIELFEQEGKGYIIVNKGMKLDIVSGNNIMILEDVALPASVCLSCKGAKIKTSVCIKCNGLKKLPDDRQIAGEPITYSDCGRCSGEGKFINECVECAGKGYNLKIITELNQARPTSGVIVAQGPECSLYKNGEKVAYSGYTGHLLPFKGNNRIRIMTEREPFCRVTMVGEFEGEKLEFLDKDTAYDIT